MVGSSFGPFVNVEPFLMVLAQALDFHRCVNDKSGNLPCFGWQVRFVDVF